jgi:hypothetical protein
MHWQAGRHLYKGVYIVLVLVRAFTLHGSHHDSAGVPNQLHHFPRMKNNTTSLETMQAVALSDKITLYRPTSLPTPTQSNNANEPDLIIICAWFRALPKYTAKYLAAHHTRHPYAQILLLRSNIGDMQHTPYSTQRKRLLPVIELIEALPSHTINDPNNANKKKKILLHVFSNGGSNTAVQLASAWRQTHSSPLPISAMVLDSAPGSASLRLAAKAITSSFPPRHRWWVTIAVYLFVLPLVALPALIPGGGGFLIDFCRERLNDPAFFPKGAGRVYFCSDGDELVLIGDVEAHCAAAKDAGHVADVVRFGSSGHVAHVREDAGRYWGSIWESWGSAME